MVRQPDDEVEGGLPVTTPGCGKVGLTPVKKV